MSIVFIVLEHLMSTLTLFVPISVYEYLHKRI
jgi:hypothetical protein